MFLVCKIRNWKIVISCLYLFYKIVLAHEIENLGISASGKETLRSLGKQDKRQDAGNNV